jgi:hypothetical protein
MKLEKIKRSILTGVAAMLFMAGCKEDPSLFVSRVNDPKGDYFSVRDYEEQGIRLEVVYKPGEYNALMQASGDDFSKERYAEALEGERASLRFDFRISALEAGYDILKDTLLPADYTRRIEYLTGALGEDIYLKTGSDSLDCSFFHFERTYNAIPYNNFLLGFELRREDVKEDIEIVYQDRLFGLGRVVFKFPKNLINQKHSIQL